VKLLMGNAFLAEKKLSFIGNEIISFCLRKATIYGALIFPIQTNL
jgi:hypothetical protein